MPSKKSKEMMEESMEESSYAPTESKSKSVKDSEEMMEESTPAPTKSKSKSKKEKKVVSLDKIRHLLPFAWAAAAISEMVKRRMADQKKGSPGALLVRVAGAPSYKKLREEFVKEIKPVTDKVTDANKEAEKKKFIDKIVKDAKKYEKDVDGVVKAVEAKAKELGKPLKK